MTIKRNSPYRSDMIFQACQGNKAKQRELADALKTEGNIEAATFWEYKANGGRAFSIEAMKLEQALK